MAATRRSTHKARAESSPDRATKATVSQPTPESYRILLYEEERSGKSSALQSLVDAGLRIEVDRVRRAADFKRRLVSNPYDLILYDLAFQSQRGFEALRWVRHARRDTPFIYCPRTQSNAKLITIPNAAGGYTLQSDLAHLPNVVRLLIAHRELLHKTQRAEREHRELEKQHRLLFYANPQPMWIFDRKTLGFLAVNEAAIRQYGYSRTEFLAMSIVDLWPDGKASSILKTISRKRSNGLLQAEITHKKKDDSLIRVEIASHEVNFRGVDAILVLAHDITDILKKEQRLRQFEERFSIAFRSSPMAITISRISDGLYIDVNDAFLQLLGRAREEVVGHTSSELNVWEAREERARIIEELTRSGKVSSFETRFNSRSRGIRSVQVSAELIHLERVPCVLAITNDVTEAKAMEEQLRQAQKMEAVGRLAGGVAHDFNNMLGVIMGYCDLADQRADWKAVKNDVRRIKKAAQRAAALTLQLLAFSRQQVLRPSVVNLNAVVADLLTMLLRIIAANVDLKFEPTATLGHIKADSSQIEQMLMNLVLNAGDAMPQGGRILIQTMDEELSDAYAQGHPRVIPGRYVVLSVTDTGSGMSPETLSKIFEPFFTTKPAGEGTGLGLSMVYGAIQQAGGHIDVYSEEGKGTTFRLYFPRVEEDIESRPPDESETMLARGRETVLLVEDEAAFREMTAELLRREGYTVLEASDGPAAVAKSAKYAKKIHVLLTDLVLPGLSGQEVAGRVLKSRPRIRVIYMSGYSGRLVANQGLLDSSAALLPKPFTRVGLLRQLRVVLDAAA